MRSTTIALAALLTCGNAGAAEVVQLHFQPDCELAQLRSDSPAEPLRFAGRASEDEDGMHCSAAIERPQFDRQLGMCAISAIQLRAGQADNYLCAVTYSSWQARFEYRYRRQTDGLRPLCMFACTRAGPPVQP